MEKGTPIPVIITAYQDRSFTFEMKQPPVTFFLKKAANLKLGKKPASGHKTPGRGFIGKVTRDLDDHGLNHDLRAALVEVGRSSGADYVGYRFGDGTWSILSHGGLFAEYVTCDALREVARVAEDLAAFEHVTNYVYTHPERFRTASIPVPLESVIANWRLTVDTQADLDVVRAVASGAGGVFPTTIEQIAAIIDRHPALVESMRASIERNRK
jgi:hypothetical protein